MTQKESIKAQIYKRTLRTLSAKGHNSDSILVQVYTYKLAQIEATQNKDGKAAA